MWEDDLYDLGTLLRLADAETKDGDASARMEHDGAEDPAIAAAAEGQPFGSLAAKTLVRQPEPGGLPAVVSMMGIVLKAVLPICATVTTVSEGCACWAYAVRLTMRCRYAVQPCWVTGDGGLGRQQAAAFAHADRSGLGQQPARPSHLRPLVPGPPAGAKAGHHKCGIAAPIVRPAACNRVNISCM